MKRFTVLIVPDGIETEYDIDVLNPFYCVNCT